MTKNERESNQVAYRQQAKAINSTYPHDQYVAIYGGSIVGDAEDFFALYEFLKKSDIDPVGALIVQAGHDYPEKATIFTKSSQTDFDGLAGLPFLRLLEYGGNAQEFWIRSVP